MKTSFFPLAIMGMTVASWAAIVASEDQPELVTASPVSYVQEDEGKTQSQIAEEIAKMFGPVEEEGAADAADAAPGSASKDADQASGTTPEQENGVGEVEATVIPGRIVPDNGGPKSVLSGQGQDGGAVDSDPAANNGTVNNDSNVIGDSGVVGGENCNCGQQQLHEIQGGMTYQARPMANGYMNNNGSIHAPSSYPYHTYSQPARQSRGCFQTRGSSIGGSGKGQWSPYAPDLDRSENSFWNGDGAFE